MAGAVSNGLVAMRYSGGDRAVAMCARMHRTRRLPPARAPGCAKPRSARPRPRRLSAADGRQTTEGGGVEAEGARKSRRISVPTSVCDAMPSGSGRATQWGSAGRGRSALRAALVCGRGAGWCYHRGPHDGPWRWPRPCVQRGARQMTEERRGTRQPKGVSKSAPRIPAAPAAPAATPAPTGKSGQQTRRIGTCGREGGRGKEERRQHALTPRLRKASQRAARCQSTGGRADHVDLPALHSAALHCAAALAAATAYARTRRRCMQLFSTPSMYSALRHGPPAGSLGMAC